MKKLKTNEMTITAAKENPIYKITIVNNAKLYKS